MCDEWHSPRLYGLPLQGLLIEEGWKADSKHILLPLTATLLVLMVVAAKLVYGDWGTAWTFGGFLVALVTLAWMWANHAVG
jgi:hypothetical protein